jgi:hypothetical protein
MEDMALFINIIPKIAILASVKKKNNLLPQLYKPNNYGSNGTNYKNKLWKNKYKYY